MKKNIIYLIFSLTILSISFFWLSNIVNASDVDNLDAITKMLEWWWDNTNNWWDTTVVNNNWWWNIVNNTEDATNAILWTSDWTSNWWNNWSYVVYGKWQYKIKSLSLKEKVDTRLKLLSPFWWYTAKIWLKALVLKWCIEDLSQVNVTVNWKVVKWTRLVLNNKCKLLEPLPWFKLNRRMWLKWKELTEYISLNPNWVNLWDLLFWSIKTKYDLVINFLSVILWFTILMILLFFPSKSKEESEIESATTSLNEFNNWFDSYEDDFWWRTIWWLWTKNDVIDKLWKKLSKSSLLWMIYIVISTKRKEEDSFITKFILLTSLLITVLMMFWMWYTITDTIYSSIILYKIYVDGTFDLTVVTIWMLFLLVFQLLVIRFWIIKFYLSYLYDKIINNEWINFRLLFYNLFGSIIAISIFYILVKIVMSIIQVIVSIT